MSNTKYWVFTLNNYTEEEETKVMELQDNEMVSYIIYGRELGDNETPHLQGYIEFVNRKKLRTVKKVPGLQRAHWEKRKGTGQEASQYCKKEGNYFEWGNLSAETQGRRTDLDQVFEAVRGGATLRELWERYPSTMVRYGRNRVFQHLITYGQ